MCERKNFGVFSRRNCQVYKKLTFWVDFFVFYYQYSLKILFKKLLWKTYECIYLQNQEFCNMLTLSL